jgi:predicted tellurium resistance membrane protein TerC
MGVLASLSGQAWAGSLFALLQVLLIDLVLAGDNAVAVGMAASGLDARSRRRVILLGLGSAVVMRIALALVALKLLALIGLLFAGGLLLLWVGWKMWRDLRAQQRAARRSCSPTFPCRWTMCWRWPAPHEATGSCWCSDFCCRSP